MKSISIYAVEWLHTPCTAPHYVGIRFLLSLLYQPCDHLLHFQNFDGDHHEHYHCCNVSQDHQHE